jgi:hypothetical protein
MTNETARARAVLVLGLLLALGVPGSAGADVPAAAAAPAAPAQGPVFVGPPSVPTLTRAARDLPDASPDPNLFLPEAKRRDDYGFSPIPYSIDPKLDPLLLRDRQRQDAAPLSAEPDGFGTLVHDWAGQTSTTSPPDTNGDVGPNHYVQGVNLSVSTVRVYDKATGQVLKTFEMDTLTTASPCRNGFCDSIVLYDRLADRWILTELPSSGGNVCMYVSTTGDPTGTYYAYTFAVENSLTDFPKYGVWPLAGNASSYLMGANAGSSGRDVFAFDRAKMLQGLPATFQKFTVPELPNSGFQLVLPAGMQGNNAPPAGEPAIFVRPYDDEAQVGATTPTSDFFELWSLTVDWATPANSRLTKLPNIPMADYDMTLCGLGGIWNCMPQPDTGQKIDPIREPIHFPLHYRNLGPHQAIVGAFVVDVSGTDQAAVRWFELRKPVVGGGWTLFQEGVIGGEPGVHRAVASAAMDGQGNIAVGYTRTGAVAPYYPSIYYKGRLVTDPPGTTPQGEHRIVDATSSKTNNERWGDYAGMGVDPSDDCTFWFTTQYGGNGGTRIAAFKFDQCGCAAAPAPPDPSADAPGDNRIDVRWNDSAAAGVVRYLVLRATVAGGPYVQVGSVDDTSPGVAGGSPYAFQDEGVSGGTRYYYVIKAADEFCTSVQSAEASALATGRCRLAPAFAGLGSAGNSGGATCSVVLSWSPATASCAGEVSYNVYRGTTADFTPGPANRIASGVFGTSFVDGVGLADRVAYTYVVRATESVSAQEDFNLVHLTVQPTGPIAPENWTDTFEGAQSGGGFDRPGWTRTAPQGGINWVWSTARRNDGTHSWFAAGADAVSEKVLVSPVFGVGPQTTVSFWHTYQFQGATLACPDGGTLEITTDGGASWTVVPDAYFTAGLFNGTITAKSNPLVGKRAWCNGTLGTMTQVALNLGAQPSLLNRDVQLRWHEGDDVSGVSAGWYVDTVRVANAQVIGTCSTGTACAAPGAPSLTTAASGCSGVDLAWTPGSGTATGYNVYRGPAAGGPYAKLAGMPVTATTWRDTTVPADGPYSYVITGACDASGLTESPRSNELGASSGVAPGTTAGAGFGSKAVLSWNGTASAASYDVVRGTVSRLLASGGFAGATDACEANDVAATSVPVPQLPPAGDGLWFLVRAVNGCGAGSYDDGTEVASRDAGIAGSGQGCP